VSKCTNQHLGDKLYAYELGLLSERERDEIEIHILECACCRETAAKFAPAARLLRNDIDVRDRIVKMGAEQPVISEASGKRRIVPLLSTAAAAVILILFLILRPWQLEFHPGNELAAADNRLAVMYFENVSDPTDSARLGEIATNLLITGLSQSNYIEVMSSQRLYDILKLMGREGQRSIDKVTASEIAAKTGAKWLLIGSILQVEPALVLTCQMVDVGSGKVKAAERIDGRPGENIFALVDRLIARIKQQIPLPADALREPAGQVAEVTTHSPEAYRAYLEGVELANKMYVREAVTAFERAIRADSTFAMAYYQLASLADRKYIEKAMQYVDRASRRDGYFIRSRKAVASGDAATAIAELEEAIKHYPDEKEALYLLGYYKYTQGQYQQSIEYLLRTVEIDPLYPAAHNRLSYAYDAAGNLEKAIEEINKYIDLAPNEPNPFDSRGDLYSSHNMIDEAIDSYRKALEIKPDFYYSLSKLGELYLFKRQFAQAESCFHEMAIASDEDTRAAARMELGFALMLQCRLAEALRVFDQGMAADSLELTNRLSLEVANKLYAKSRIHLALGDSALSLKELDETIALYAINNPNDKLICRNLYAQLLAATGNLSKAQSVIDELRQASERSKRGRSYYSYAVGVVAYAKNDLDSAQACFARSVEELPDFYAHYMLARTLLQLGRADEAAREFEKVLDGNTFWYTCYELDYQDAGYYLGRAYEEAGDLAKAADRYRGYLAFWQKNYPDLPLVKDAAARLARLKV
jgi:tetratricopeptide (TPR) repeat protein